MRWRRILPAAMALGATATIGTVLAQSVTDDLDLKAIEARATREAAALAGIAAQAGPTPNADAKAAVDAARASLAAPRAGSPSAQGNADAIDLDGMIADAGKMMAPPAPAGPRFLAFASLSMPVDALRQLVGDVSRAGGTVVFRGFVPAGAGAFMKGLREAVPEGTPVRITIDPRLFKAFDIAAVPTYVALPPGFAPGSVEAPPPAFDRLSGNVTTRFALETMADGHGPGATAARAALQTLEAAP